MRHPSFQPRLEVLEDRLTPSTSPLTSVPAFSSLPGATASLYLDFNGHFEAQWGSYANITTPAYDVDGDATTFSDTELANIEKIWRYVAEDYAPFNINVTTVEPPSFANGVAMRVAIGGDGAWSGGSYGGLGYLDTFTNSIVNTVFVFAKNKANPASVAATASHEAGHGFGLDHQSSWNGGTQTEYYAGPGDGTSPLMGGGGATRTLWWYGTTDSATTFQNDMDVIARAANGFGYRSDDHGGTIGTATTLTVSAGSFSDSGIIEKMSDVDYFSFSSGAGTVTLSVNVPSPYNNLDARLELRDTAGNLLASASPTTSFGATITATVAEGNYYLVVASAGISANATATNYGFNVGQFTVTGTVASTTTPTGPAAASGLAAAASSSSQINLTWTDNAANEDGFKIERLVGTTWTQVATVGANIASWQDGGLTGGTSYTYRVRAYNTSGDSANSNNASASTLVSSPAAPSNLMAAASSDTQINLTWTDNAGNENGFKIERLVGATWTQVATVGANVTSWQNSGLTAGTSYSYRVRAYNTGGDSAYSNTASATTNSAPAPVSVTVPAAPANLTALSISSTRANLSWTDTSNDETGFVIQRRTTGGKWATIAQVGANITSFSDTTLNTRKSYEYRVYAVNAAGNSSYSNVAAPVAASLAGADFFDLPFSHGPANGLPTQASDVVFARWQEHDFFGNNRR